MRGQGVTSMATARKSFSTVLSVPVVIPETSQAWFPRWSKGVPGLVCFVVDGYRGWFGMDVFACAFRQELTKYFITGYPHGPR